MWYRVLFLFCAFLVTGCGKNDTASPSQVAAVEVGTTAAINAANSYLRLPPCPQAPVCHNPANRPDVIKGIHAAYDAFKAYKASPTPGTQAASVAALTQLNALMPVVQPVSK